MVGDKRRIWQVAFGVLLLVAFSASAFAQEEAAEAAAGLDVIEMFRTMGPTAWGVAIVLLIMSFLSVGVQPPDASWGTIISDGLGRLYTRPAVAIAPGLLIAVTTIALNLFGDGLRDVLDPKIRGLATERQRAA